MRTNFLLVSLAALLAACSEQQQPTSPATGLRSEPHPSGDYNAGTNAAAPVQQAKPVDQVGFTQAVVLTSGVISVTAGQVGVESVSCPDGSVAIGGGYQILGGPNEATAVTSRPTTLPTPRGWAVGVNNRLGATDASFNLYVVCVS